MVTIGTSTETRARRDLRPLLFTLLVIPSAFLVVVVFILPFLRLLAQAAFDFTYVKDLDLAFGVQSALWKVLTNSVVIATQSTAVTLVLAYPLCFLLTRVSPRANRLMFLIIMIPFWTSVLVRTYAWVVILNRTGIVNEFLIYTGIVEQPLKLLYNRFAVVVGMTHYLLPFMIFSLYSGMKGVNYSMIEASSSMGASPLQTFLKVYLPLTLPAVYAGCLSIFILAIGFYITPALMGGPGETMISVYIQQQIQLLNWSEGTLMAACLVGLLIVLFSIYNWAFSLENLTRGTTGGRP
ncbi:MAG: ABC transporter permease [Proteobacteria bacterium]|jgi:ABC-type spermidine/putrescine transport system permease subunit I|nr:ABC transporter permease [Pseudomonadota bacterium]